MAKLKSLLKVQGTLDDISFYRKGGKYFARLKGGVDGARIANDPKFKRTRENASEFGLTARAGKTLRSALRAIIQAQTDKTMHQRLSKVLHQIKRYDAVSRRGERLVSQGLEQEAGRNLLIGFNFNEAAPLAQVLKVIPELDASSGVISIMGIKPQKDLIVPAGATHFQVGMAWSKVDLDNGKFSTVVEILPEMIIDAESKDLVLTPSSTPEGEGRDLFVLQVLFLQEMNGDFYALFNETVSSTAIIGVS